MDDFGYNGGNNGNAAPAGVTGGPASPDVLEDVTDINSGEPTSKNGATPLDKGGEGKPDTGNEPNPKPDEKPGEGTPSGEGNGDDTNNSIPKTEGTELTIGEDTYHFDANGNLLDKDNNIFKKSEEVDDYLKDFQLGEGDGDSEPTMNLKAVQDLLGIEVVDEHNKVVKFEDTEEGIKSYVNSVIQTKTNEGIAAGVNRLFETYPFLTDIINYYVANGNSLEGFNEVKDRSSVELDVNNEAQQEAIVREACKEFNRAGDIDSYIKYLKDTKQLAAVAATELQALKDADAKAKEETAKAAKAAQAEAEQKEIAYWTSVKKIVDSRKIAGYQIPETIIVKRNGKDVAVTANDFFNYIYQIDDEGYTRYQRELASQKPEDRMNDDILRAYLTFTGKNYNSLVDMAIAKKQVQKLKLVASKNHGKSGGQTISVKPAAKDKLGGESFGY